MKKTVSILLVLLMLTFAIAGCGTNSNDTISDDSNQSGKTVSSVDAEVSGTQIDLNDYTDQLVIDAAGEYVLSGTINNTVKVEVNSGTVTLHLNGAAIKSTSTAALLATSGDKLIVDLVDGSTNSIADGGSAEDYDAAIFSEIPLEFTGNGNLTVNGNNQEGISTENAALTFNGGNFTVISADDGIGAGGDQGGTLTFNSGTFYINASGDGIDSNSNIVFNGGDIYVIGSAAGGDAGIDSDGGYVINGGSIIALGTDMIETPQTSSTQKTLAFTLESSVAQGSTVKVTTTDGTTVAEFTADQAFLTLVVSNSEITDGIYNLYVNGEKVSVGGETDFEVNSTVNYYGSDAGMQGNTPPDGEFSGDSPDGNGPDGEMPGNPPDGEAPNNG